MVAEAGAVVVVRRLRIVIKCLLFCFLLGFGAHLGFLGGVWDFTSDIDQFTCYL